MINIYKASAGSGKTFTLVREFLKLLLGRKVGDNRYALDEHPNENHRSILAITFTNKATEEMKKRIVKELDILAGQPDRSPYADFLAKALNAPIEKSAKRRKWHWCSCCKIIPISMSAPSTRFSKNFAHFRL